MKLSIQSRSNLLLLLNTFLVTILSIILAFSLKYVTELVQLSIFNFAEANRYLFLVLPTTGITLIYFLRKFIFHGKKNKGIKEIYSALNYRKNSLPLFKITSHYINGFLTVIFGGSTGIEVSTVVSTAAIGSNTHHFTGLAKKHKQALVCAAVASGIAVLFNSPLAGGLFAIEVIARKKNLSTFIMTFIAILITGVFINISGQEYLFEGEVLLWKWQAIPYFFIVSVLAAIAGVYFTKTVLFFKDKLGAINNNFLRVNIGALTIGGLILLLPQLYGDSYHSLPYFLENSLHSEEVTNILFIILACIILKPLAASLTLGAGGDGGVFAPSIVTGAFIGLFVAFFANKFLGMELIPLNFALLGAATMLSAAIHAPFTALFLACSIVDGGYILFIPIAICVFLSKFIASYLCSYTIYTFNKSLPIKN